MGHSNIFNISLFYYYCIMYFNLLLFRCSRNCITSLSYDHQIEIFQRFLSLNIKDEQDVFLQNMISRKSKRKRKSGKEQQVIRLS